MLSHTIVFVVTVSLVIVQSVESHIIYVPDDFNEAQEALNISLSGDTVILRAGRYTAPIIIPAHELTVGSEFILTQDESFISNCVVAPEPNQPMVRCIDTEAAGRVTLNLIGVTIQQAFMSSGDGGGIRLRNRKALISNCVFKNCAAINGGTIFADSSSLSLIRTSMSGSDALDRGRCIYARTSKVDVNDCDLHSSSALMPTMGWQSEIELVNSPLHVVSSRLENLGNAADRRTTIVSLSANSVCDSVTFFGCTIADNSLAYFAYSGNSSRSGMRTFILDSCYVLNNALAFGFFADWQLDSLSCVVITRNWFEDNHRPGPNYNGAGLFTFSAPQVSAIVEENHFLANDGGGFSCILAEGNREPAIYRVHRNYFSGNSNFGFSSPPGGAAYLLSLSAGVLEYNSFDGNIGHSVDTGESGTESYALHNFWGDSTGPYVAEEHPQGLGDTTDTETIYDEWLEGEDEIPDTTLFPLSYSLEDRKRIMASSWIIRSVFPNPFNSTISISLDVPLHQDMTIILYDLLGREVDVIHRGRLQNTVLSYSTPPNLSSGIYFVSATSATRAEMRKIILLK